MVVQDAVERAVYSIINVVLIKNVFRQLLQTFPELIDQMID